jgi:hypothetical protein
MIDAQANPRPIREFFGHLARSFFEMLGEVATRLDELPIEDKQEIKEGLIRLLSINGKPAASIKLLTMEDEELSGILSSRGWWVLHRDINGPVKRELLRLGREGKTSEIDSYLCSLFNEKDGARLTEKVAVWFKVPYLADRKQIILDSLEAHKAGKWTLTVPTLLPLIDGLIRRFRKEHLRPSKNPNRVMHVDQFAEYYQRNQPKLLGKPVASFMHKYMFANFHFNNGVAPSSINRHAILHGEIFDYATEANSLRVILFLDTMSQFVQVIERRRKASAARKPKAT